MHFDVTMHCHVTMQYNVTMVVLNRFYYKMTTARLKISFIYKFNELTINSYLIKFIDFDLLINLLCDAVKFMFI